MEAVAKALAGQCAGPKVGDADDLVHFALDSVMICLLLLLVVFLLLLLTTC